MAKVQVTVELPESVHQYALRLAAKHGMTLEELVMIALAERIGSLDTISYLEERAKRGSAEKLREILAKVPDVEPEEYDRL
jgi:hypothetical protein